MINIKTVSGVTATKVHFNDNGNQFSVNATHENIEMIRRQLLQEIENIEIIVSALNEEIENYTPIIESIGRVIEGLNMRIAKEVENKNPLFVRQLAVEYFDLKHSEMKMTEVYNNRNGLYSMLTRKLDLKEKYKEMLRQCKAILK